MFQERTNINQWIYEQDVDVISHVPAHTKCTWKPFLRSDKLEAIYTYIYILIYICFYVYIHILVYIHKYVHIYIYICIYNYLDIYVYICMYIYIIYLHMFIYMYTCMYVYMYMCIYVYMYVYM